MKKLILLSSLFFTMFQLLSMDTNYDYLNACLIQLQLANIDTKVFACCNLQTKDILRQTCTTFAQYIPTNYDIYNHSPLTISDKQAAQAIDFALEKSHFKILDNVLLDEQKKLYALQKALNTYANQVFEYVLTNHPPNNINTAFDNGETLLTQAAYLNNIFAIQHLLKSSQCNINETISNNCTPLYIACQKGNTEIVKLLLLNKASIHILFQNQYTPLYAAVISGNVDTVRVLLEHNPEQINQNRADVATPLYLACQQGNTEIVKLLLLNKASIHILFKNQYTPLDAAINNKNINIIRILLNHSTEQINTTTLQKRTPLTRACETGCAEIIELLLSYKASIDILDIYQYTPLHIAVLNNNIEIVKTLLQHSSKQINQADPEGITPLHLAAEQGYTEIVYFLCQKGADKNSLALNNCTPLYIAVQNRHIDTIKILLHYPEVINLINITINKQTMLDVSYKNNHPEIVNLLRSHGAKTKEEIDNDITAPSGYTIA